MWVLRGCPLTVSYNEGRESIRNKMIRREGLPKLIFDYEVGWWFSQIVNCDAEGGPLTQTTSEKDDTKNCLIRGNFA